MQITSGPLSGYRNRLLIATLLFLGAAGWFGWDGWRGYAAANVTEMKSLLPADAQGSVVVDPRVTKEFHGTTLEVIKGDLGFEPPVQSQKEARYFGIDGFLTMENKSTGMAEWKTVRYSQTDILLQKIIAFVLLGVGLIMLFRLMGAIQTRVVLDDAGLRLPSGQTVAWEAMRSLATNRYRDKGWVDLEYDAGGASRVFRIDSYQLAEFDAIVDEICTRKGFENPLAKQG